MNIELSKKRILVTQSDAFMGPAICEALNFHGAEVVAQVGTLSDPAEPARIVEGAGKVDVLVANLALEAPRTPAADVTDAEWGDVPLGRLVSANEDASFVAYLCSDAADCFVGQVFPVSGGWVTR